MTQSPSGCWCCKQITGHLPTCPNRFDPPRGCAVAFLVLVTLAALLVVLIYTVWRLQ
jgi:hypothetical protein